MNPGWLVLIASLLRHTTAHAASCQLLLDGQPAVALDCIAPGAWSVRCELPAGGGQVSVRAAMPARGIEAFAGLPLSARGTVELPLSGPRGRSGVFVVREPVAGLLSGQALGPNQLCPIVQPDVAPGSPRGALPIEITATVYRRTGLSERMEGGVAVLQPVYDEGMTFASLRAPVRQRPVGTVPVLLGELPPPTEEPFTGQLQVLVGEGSEARWSSFGYRGHRRELPVTTGDVTLMIADFVGPEVDAAVAADGATFLAEDLALWLADEPTSRLGISAWSRSGFEPALLSGTGEQLQFRPQVVLGRTWWATSTDRLAVRIGSHDDRLRVVIAWRAAPWDDEVTAAVDAAAEQGIAGP